MSARRDYRKWTPEEDALMREIYVARVHMSELVARFGRRSDALWRRAKHLGLTRIKGLGCTGPRGLRPGYIRWTPEADAALRKMYMDGALIADLVQSLGHPKDAIYKRARQLDLSRSRKEQPLGPNQVKVLTLAARPCGVSAEDTGLPLNAAGAACSSLKKRGFLFRAALGVRTVRWFTTQKAAERYVAENQQAHQAKAKSVARNARPGWGPKDPPCFTAQTKWTFAPPPPAMVWRTNTFSPL